MRKLVASAIVAFVAAVIAPGASAQMILTGCTATTNIQPSNLVALDLATGLASNPRDIGIQSMTGIATQPVTGTLFGLTSVFSNPANALVTINPITGTYSLVGFTGMSDIVEGDLAFNPVNGQLYGLADVPNSNVRNLFQINSATGTATLIGDVGSFGNTTDYSALAFSSNGTMFAIDSAGLQNSKLITIDPLTAQITSTLTMNVNLGSAVGMTFHPTTGLACVADRIPSLASGGTNSLYHLDVLTGNTTLIGSTGDLTGIAGLAFVVVPEPSSMTFVLIGLACGILKTSIRRMPLARPWYCNDEP